MANDDLKCLLENKENKHHFKQFEEFKNKVIYDCWLNDRYSRSDIKEYLKYLYNIIEKDFNIIKKYENKEDLKNIIECIRINKEYLSNNMDDFVVLILREMDKEDEILRSCI